MIIWHYRLIPLLPNKELYILNLLCKLVTTCNYATKYPLAMWGAYNSLILTEMRNRKLKRIKWGFANYLTRWQYKESIKIPWYWKPSAITNKKIQQIHLSSCSNLQKNLEEKNILLKAENYAWKRKKIVFSEFVPEKYLNKTKYRIIKGKNPGELLILKKTDKKTKILLNNQYYINKPVGYRKHLHIFQPNMQNGSFPHLFPDIFNDQLYLAQLAELIDMNVIKYENGINSRIEDKEGDIFIQEFSKSFN